MNPFRLPRHLLARLLAWVTAELAECTDEGVRLGIGAAVRHLEYLADTEATYLGREALQDAADDLRQMSADYAAIKPKETP